MLIFIAFILLIAPNSCLYLIDVPEQIPKPQENKALRKMNSNTRPDTMKVGDVLQIWEMRRRDATHDNEKDANIKIKIATLVQQMLHDTDRKVKSILPIKEANKGFTAYKIGFLLSMIKKARDVLNELFNVAVKHRDHWKALEQLKVFELIVHTNVDTSNLVRQLVELHLSNTRNSTMHVRSHAFMTL